MTRSKPVDPNSDFRLVAVPVSLELPPHVYSPDTSAGMGDCKCGNSYDDPIHIRPSRIEPATPEFLLLKEIRSKVGAIADREQDAAVYELWAEALAYLDRLIDDRMSRWG